MAHVFISYAHIDGDFASLMKHELEKSEFEVWLDTEKLQAGDDWRQEIDDAIRNAFALIAVMTPEASDSKYVTYEWACAWGAKVKVIPIMLKSTPFHPRLDALHYLDFTNRGARPWDELNKRLRGVEEEYAPNTIPVSYSAPPLVKRAIEALNTSYDPNERQAAISSLAQTNHPTAVEGLILATQHLTTDVRIGSAIALIQMKDFQDTRALPALCEAYPQASLDGRVKILKLIAKNKYISALPLVLEALDENVPAVPYAAIEALGELKDASAIPALKKLLIEGTLKSKFADPYDKYLKLIEQSLKLVGTPEALTAVEVWRAQQTNTGG